MREEFKVKPINDFFKRIFDVFSSFTAIILLSPFFVFIAIMIRLTSDGPVFFKQIRVGKDGIFFEIYKFRTMVKNAEKLGKQITVGNDERITKIGVFLRKYKLDELPQLMNVLKGDMSIVGPRPEVPKYTKMYSDEQKNVLLVKPGITDYASIKYRNENIMLNMSNNPEKTYIEEVMVDKININLEYIKKRSVIEDIKIVFLTLWKIIF